MVVAAEMILSLARVLAENDLHKARGWAVLPKAPPAPFHAASAAPEEARAVRSNSSIFSRTELVRRSNGARGGLSSSSPTAPPKPDDIVSPAAAEEKSLAWPPRLVGLRSCALKPPSKLCVEPLRRACGSASKVRPELFLGPRRPRHRPRPSSKPASVSRMRKKEALSLRRFATKPDRNFSSPVIMFRALLISRSLLKYHRNCTGMGMLV